MLLLIAIACLHLVAPCAVAARRAKGGLRVGRLLYRATAILVEDWVGVWIWFGGMVAFGAAGLWQNAHDDNAAMFAFIFACLDLLFALVVVSNALATGANKGGGEEFGSARAATRDHAELKGLIGETGIRLGYLPVGEDDTRAAGRLPLHYTGLRHLLTVAPTRSGKGVSAVIPNLLTHQGSAIVIDPKGENAQITHDRRAAMGRAYALDPWGISGKPVARFNPLDLLTAASPTLIEDAMLIAEALIVREADAKDGFWSDEAQALIMGFLVHIATAPSEAGSRHLGRLRDILTASPGEMEAIYHAMATSEVGIVSSSLNRIMSKSPDELSGVFSTAQQNTHFLESQSLRASLEASDFSFADLKGATPYAVFIVLPVDRLVTHNRWMRMIVALAIAALARNPAKPERPVLFMLDEIAALGRLKPVEEAYGLMAGMGLQLHAIVQDFNQLERLYGRGWETFVANSGVIQVFGTRDLKTTEYVSKMAGKATVSVRTMSISSGSGQSQGSSSTSYAPAQRALVNPDEIRRMGDNSQLLFIENADPVFAHRLIWYQEPYFQALAEGGSPRPTARPN